MERNTDSRGLRSNKSEHQPLIGDDAQPTITRVYKKRWGVLAVFCFACMSQAMVWNTWGPIADSVEVVLGWSDGTVALMPNLGNIAYLILVIPVSVLMDTKGLRFSMILCILILVICTVIRCFTLEPSIFTPVAYISAFLQGITGTVPFAAPPLVAAVWFPLDERPTATAIGSFFNYFGVATSFLLGPLLVPGPVYDALILRNISSSNTSISKTNVVVNLQDLKSGISNLMYTQVGIVVLLLASILIFFPAKPAQPPSITASLERTDYKHALPKIAVNVPLWIISIAGSLPVGIAGTWIAIIDVIVKDIGVSQVDAGWMGVWNSLIGCLAGIFIAKYSSFFHRRRKLYLTGLFTFAAAFTIWFSLLCDSVLPYSLPSLYASCIFIGIFINGTSPLFYEMAAEASYPVGEGVTGGFYTFLYNLFGIIFLSLVSVPNIGITWLNWTVLGSLCLSIPMLLVFPERYKRSDIDMEIVHSK